jgi:hypothetical protein
MDDFLDVRDVGAVPRDEDRSRIRFYHQFVCTSAAIDGGSQFEGRRPASIRVELERVVPASASGGDDAVPEEPHVQVTRRLAAIQRMQVGCVQRVAVEKEARGADEVDGGRVGGFRSAIYSGVEK